VVMVAGFALVIDILTAMLTFSLAKQSMNMRAAFLHNVADVLGSVAVIVAGTLILLYDWRLIDPIVTLLIAGYILWQSFIGIGPVIRIVMLGSPPDLDADRILTQMNAVDGVASVHHLHLWQMQEHENALDAHLVISQGNWNNADAVKSEVRKLLGENFSIFHSTLEIECWTHACTDPITIGH
jgi:cobalt-zinc-cadmium efflux system protein